MDEDNEVNTDFELFAFAHVSQNTLKYTLYSPNHFIRLLGTDIIA